MPNAAPKPCKVCRALVSDGTERCEQHKVKAGSYADKRRGSRHERGYGTAWDRARAETLSEQGGICQPHLRRGQVVPGCRIVDHIVPKAQGGTDDKANRQTICSECHGVKSSVEALLARGLQPDVDDAVLASLTPVGVAIAGLAPRHPAAPARASDRAGGGEIFGAFGFGTDLQVKFSRAGNPGGGGTPAVSKGGV